jgi:hypothetical protein
MNLLNPHSLELVAGMTLSLLVYAALEHRICDALK